MKSPRIALWVWYRGDFFRGFQSQREGPTVQDSLQAALLQVGVRSRAAPAGRTDKGVHARMQVLSLRLREMSAEELVKRLSLRPFPGFGICCARQAPDGFHAQWSSIGKEYRYRLRFEPRAAPEWGTFSWVPAEHPRLLKRAVDVNRLAQLLHCCEGTHDFAAFHERSSTRGPRTVHSADLAEVGGGVYEIRLRGNRFARYQIRYLVGTAVAVSAGAIPEKRFAQALHAAQSIDGVKAPARGLILWEVRYSPATDPFTEDRTRPPALPGDPPFGMG